MKDKIRQAVFTVETQLDQASRTFANTYYKALFDTSLAPSQESISKNDI